MSVVSFDFVQVWNAQGAAADRRRWRGGTLRGTQRSKPLTLSSPMQYDVAEGGGCNSIE
jgi:hypothetical protein